MLLPGDVAVSIVGEHASQAQLERVREELGLNRPIMVQYKEWFFRIIRGDFGRSLRLGQPVLQLIMRRIPVTFQLAFVGLLLSIFIGVTIGIVSATKHDSVLDFLGSFFSMAGIAMPNFWLGMLFILFFSLYLGILPSSGFVPIREDFFGNLRTIIGPSIATASNTIAIVMRQTRASMLEVLGEDYIRTARAKGLNDRIIHYKHALRNALIPVTTVLGLQLGH